MPGKEREARWINEILSDFGNENPNIIMERNAATLYHRILHGDFGGRLDPTSKLGKIIIEVLSPNIIEKMRSDHKSLPKHKFEKKPK